VANRIAGLGVVVCWLALGLVPAHAQDASAWKQYIEEAKGAYRRRDYGRTEQLLRAALQEAEKFGPDDPRVAVTLNNQANLAAARNRPAEAEPLYRRSVDLLEKARGPDHPQTALARLGLADFLAAQHHYDRAEPEYQHTLRSLEQCLGPAHPIVATVLERYALLLRKTGRADDAARLEARARDIRGRPATAGERP
jgi:tetratricopeptide (TPR) repeat protein